MRRSHGVIEKLGTKWEAGASIYEPNGRGQLKIPWADINKSPQKVGMPDNQYEALYAILTTTVRFSLPQIPRLPLSGDMIGKILEKGIM